MLSTTNNTRPNNTPRNKNKTKKNSSQLEYLQLSYLDTVLQNIKNNQDITNIPNITNVSTIYSKPPKIKIQNAKSKLYLISMTDPDAPNGIQQTNKTMNKSTQNHTYTHWVYLQDMRKQNTTNTSNIPPPTQIIVPYAPPTPPKGIHRYQFKIYDLTNLPQTILDTIKNKINNKINTNPDRNTYYRNNLKKIVKYKLNTMFQYKVNSKK
jgi:phosphatidylethanolamine-binding protein (PEBP) family uncharacterized protein